MRVFIKSQRKYGELLSFTLGPVPVSGLDERTKQIVQGMQMMPVGVILVEQRFVYAPLSDLTVDTFEGEATEVAADPVVSEAEVPPIEVVYKEASQNEE